jgi:antitoxin ParD1/3/4
MSSSLNIQLTTELRRFVDERASDHDVYATPSEYVRDLIRRDMEKRRAQGSILRGLDDIKNNRFATETVDDIIKEFQ